MAEVSGGLGLQGLVVQAQSGIVPKVSEMIS